MSLSRIAVSKVAFDYKSLDEAFPTVDCGHEPYGCFVIVQIRLAKRKTKGGIILIDDARHTEADNTQVAKVVKVGAGAFMSRADLTPWPEGPWYQPGDFVRCPKYGGDRWTVSFEHTADGVRETEAVEFALFKDLDCRAKVVGDPLRIKSFL